MATPKRYPIRIQITTAFSILILLVGGAIAWVSYQRTAGMLEKNAAELVQRLAYEVATEINRIRASSRTSMRLLAVSPNLGGHNLEARLKVLPGFATILRNSPEVAALHFGDYDGNYFLVYHLRKAEDIKVLSAPQGTRFVVQSIDRALKPAQSLYLFFDDGLRELGRREVPQALQFDPRQRSWFKLADRNKGIVRTEPYVFSTSHEIGYSIAMKTSDGKRIVSEAFRLDTVNQLLARQRMTPGSRLVVMDDKRRVYGIDTGILATSQKTSDNRDGSLIVSELKHPALAALGSLETHTTIQGRPEASFRRTEIGGETWHLDLISLPLGDAQPMYLGIAVPDAELFAEARLASQRLLLLTLGLLLAGLPVAIWLSRQIAQPLSTLVRETEAMRRFDFDTPIRVDSFILEVDELAMTLRNTKETLSRFIDIITRVTNEADFNQLLPDLLQITTEAARAEGGLLFMLSGHDRNIQAVAGRWESSILSLEAAASEDFDGFAIKEALETGRSVSTTVADAACARFGLPHTDAVSVPLFTRGKEPIGVLVLLNREPIDPLRIRFIEALSGFAAVSLETRELIAKQKALFESFIRMMASAIDAKSPYTGNHCARVPEAVKMLAEAACAQTEGTYADFSMSPDEWEALHIAAWLHDCGKVTTPEYVVDKATKLETLYDRIHEIRTRFEVLKCDAEIVCLRAIAAGADAAQAQAERDDALKALDDDFTFVATCNEGGEFMAAEHVARLKKIAERTWLRTLDDRIGISAEERKRKNAVEAPTLPVKEPLLSDRPELRIARPSNEQFDQTNPWGFTMQVPELLYDRGELKNLMIARGTLGDEERYKINEHIIQTIVMLSALPFPSHLSKVPEIAGGHHERTDGKGYPRGLTGAQMSPLARMMAIADVFEALTASDRPYKLPKTLSQSLDIMKRMADEGHIDPELFEIFVRSGVCLRYAERFLDPSQRDTEDFEHFLPSK